MKNHDLGRLAVSAAALFLIPSAYGMNMMDMTTVKEKDGKSYFCANAKCAGNSECAGAGNPKCGSLNRCANTDQKYLVGWLSAKSKEECEKDGAGKWLVYDDKYSPKGANEAPLGPKSKAHKASAKKSESKK